MTSGWLYQQKTGGAATFEQLDPDIPEYAHRFPKSPLSSRARMQPLVP
jgi:hypothetical protein